MVEANREVTCSGVAHTYTGGAALRIGPKISKPTCPLASYVEI